MAALGVQFVSLPMAGTDDLTPAAAEKIAAELAAADDKTTLVHCGSSNRVGVLLAMKASNVDKQAKEPALEFGKSAGLTKMLPTDEAKLRLRKRRPTGDAAKQGRRANIHQTFSETRSA